MEAAVQCHQVLASKDHSPIASIYSFEDQGEHALILELSHRVCDLKPASIKILPGGTVKVLDLGLGRAIEPGPTDAVAAQTPTIDR